MIKLSKWTLVKSHNGKLYKDLCGQDVEFLYKVRVCNGGDCSKCKKYDDGNPLREGKVKIKLGDGTLHEYIEKILLSEDIQQGSAVAFFLTAEDAYGDKGVKEVGSNNMVIKPGESICCYIIEPV